MCGICGVVAVSHPLDPGVSEAIVEMTDVLRHRGPDGSGFYRDSFAALGHRRLAIIDRAGGGQPMANEDKSVWIVFNGEIYNHLSLRQLLVDRGHQFRTHSDTETILHAYEEFGDQCVERLHGMFAFAVWNAPRRQLFVARDRVGKKPLFFARFGDVFHFASEIKAIAASPLWQDELDLENIETYLSLGYFLAPGSIYRHVNKLQPGWCLTLRDGHLSQRQYWDVEEFDNDRRATPAILAGVDQLIESAVVDRLESEVPLGAFLSGGIDSGLVVSYMAGALPSVTTSTVGFAHAAHNELDAASMTATHFHTNHTSRIIDPDLESVFDRIVWAFDEPFADPSAIPTYYVSQVARESVTVALTGDGGDEAFGGYDFRYLPHMRDARLRALVPGASARALCAWLGAAWPRRSLPRALRIGNVLENVGRSEAGAYYSDLCFIKPRETRELMGHPARTRTEAGPAFERVAAAYNRCQSSDPIQRAEYADLKVYLPNGPLVKVDRMSMSHSLEIRCPLLDHRIIEQAFRIPIATKMPRLRSKYLLRALAEQKLPAGISNLPKLGFTAPIGEWIRGPHNDWFRSEVLSPKAAVASLLNMSRLNALAAEHFAGVANHWHPLWAVWALERWLRQHSEARHGQTTTARRPPAVSQPG